jgi:hypothetical protein
MFGIVGEKMAKENNLTTFEFLANKVYLPGYMALRGEDYDSKGAIFNFDIKEPPVARGSIVHYFTPRGLHICVSQAGYALVEHLVSERLVDDLELSSLRQTLLEGRVKITELYQKFRKEIELGKPIQGRFDISRFRQGKLPILKLDFAFENGAVSGNLMSLIAPRPMPQMNQDLMRKR